MIKINIISEFSIENCEKQYSINLRGGLFEDENSKYFGYKNFDLECSYGYWSGRCKRFSLATVKMLRLY